jgi:glutathione S-transferase
MCEAFPQRVSCDGTFREMPEQPTHPLKLGGGYGSPYSLKMRAVLRYRRIPFTWVPRDSQWDDLPPVPVRLIPVIAFPDADGNYHDAQIDSSPLIERLEAMYPDRSLVPADPVVAFIDYLIEDYGDEWVTKQMYHYRWYYDDAIDKAGSLLPLDQDQQMSEHRWQRAKQFITDRQIGRRALVGSTEQNRPVIEQSYERLLDLMQLHLTAQPFLLGERPGRGDFGVFGQLRQLVAWDPESARVAIARAPRVVNWVERTDDLSWWHVDGAAGWCDRTSIPTTTIDLLGEIGRTYAPFMLANTRAIEAGSEEVVCQIDGHEYRQAPFAYQFKCLTWLRARYTALAPADRAAVDDLLAGTGCEALFD